MAKFNFLWPEIDTIDDAKKAAHIGAGCAFLVSAVTAVVTVLTMQGVKLFAGMTDASSFLDAGLFLMIGIFIYRYSRVAAIAGLLLYIGEQIVMMKTTGFRFSLIPIFFTCHFISGVRGTFDYHQLKKVEDQEAKASEPPPQVFPQVEKKPKKTRLFLKIIAAVFVLVVMASAIGYFFLSRKKENIFSEAANARDGVQRGEVPLAPVKESAVTSQAGERTFHMKDGNKIIGRVLMEDDVYYTVETSGGRQEIIIKEDMAVSGA